jgi:hypothetical protein
VRAGDKFIPYSTALAPVVGYALMALVSFPLLRFVGPIRDWAIPLTALLLLGSGILVFLAVRRGAFAQMDWRKNIRRFIFPIVALGIVGLVLSIPFWRYGINYTIFRSNSSDAFVYMTYAESARVVDWHTYRAGADLTAQNLDAVRQLALASPTALLSARFAKDIAQLNHPGVIAWLAQLHNLPVFRFYFIFNSLMFFVAFCASFVLANVLRLPRVLQYLGAATIALGFWAHFILETDAGGEIAMIPILLLLVFAWWQTETEESNRLLSRTRVLLVLAIAGVVCVYSPIVPLIVLGFILYYAFVLLTKRNVRHTILSLAATAAGVVILLTLTLQIDNILAIFNTLLFNAVGLRVKNEPIVFQMLAPDPLSTFWGLPGFLYFGRAGGTRNLLMNVALWIVGATFFAGLLGNFVFSIRRRERVAERILFALILSAGVIALVMLWREYLRNSGRTLGYVYPYLLYGALGVTTGLTGWRAISEVWARRAQWALTAVFAVGMILQIALVITIPTLSPSYGIFKNAQTNRHADYEVAAIETQLKKNPPRALVVDVPNDTYWERALYSLFVFQPFRANFLNGVVVDNGTRFQNIITQAPELNPDYVVLTKKNDYLQDSGIATRLAENQDLALYRIERAAPDLFARRASEVERANKAKPFFEPGELK